ncbi:hypothetical protein [Pedobacter agri]|uniref:hypothetical protein n=1 Tax=Pedobacter agri TaxID=454586 RepID=UPI00292F53B6|nr:hypothetical protein [Pedobacter agri]
MRRGVVISYNKTAGFGFIKDTNNQKICFHNEDPLAIFKRFEMVQFEISFVGNSLQAVNVMHVLDKNRQPLSISETFIDPV